MMLKQVTDARLTTINIQPSRSMSRSKLSRSWHVFAQQQIKPWVITRGASSSQRLPILKTLLAEKLNPLSLDMKRFVVATTSPSPSAEQSRLIGFGQLKPLDTNALELSSLVVDPEYR